MSIENLQEIEDMFPTEAVGRTQEENPAKREGIPLIVTEEVADKTCDYEYADVDPIP